VPLVIVLATWWRERIDALAELGAHRNPILTWSSQHRTGMVGALGRIAAWAAHLAQGGREIVARRISQLALSRDIAGQRARTRASARVVADEASGRYLPIPLEQAQRLSPHGRPVSDSGNDIRAPQPVPPMKTGRIV